MGEFVFSEVVFSGSYLELVLWDEQVDGGATADFVTGLAVAYSLDAYKLWFMRYEENWKLRGPY